MPTDSAVAERPRQPSPPEEAPDAARTAPVEAVAQPEAPAGPTTPIFVREGRGREARITVKQFSGELRYSKDGLPEYYANERWNQVPGALKEQFQVRFTERWAQADGPDRGQIVIEAENFYEYLEGKGSKLSRLRSALKEAQAGVRRLSDEKELAKQAAAGVTQGRFATREEALAVLSGVRSALEAKLSRLEPAVQELQQFLEPHLPGVRASKKRAPEVDPVALVAADEVPTNLAEAVEASAVDESLAPGQPQPELVKSVVGAYAEHQEQNFADWVVTTLREAGPASAAAQVEEAATAGLSEQTVERESQEDLVATSVMLKVEQDVQAAAVNTSGRYESLRETLASLGVAAEAPLGEQLVKEVTEATAAEPPTVRERRYLPSFVVERLRSLLMTPIPGREFGGEIGQAVRFRQATEEAARDYLGSVQDKQLGLVEGESGDVVEDAVAGLRERLAKLRSFGGEGMQARLLAKEGEVRQLLEQELAKSRGILQDVDIETLAQKLRDNLDQRYWWRYVLGTAEVAVAGAIGGYFLFWKGGSAVAARATRAGVRTGMRRVGGAVLRAAAKKVAPTLTPAPVLEAPAPVVAEAVPPTELVDEVAVQSSLWSTVRRAASESGLNPSNSELMQMVIKVARQNDIAIRAWGIAGRVRDTAIPVGTKLRGVRDVLREFAG